MEGKGEGEREGAENIEQRGLIKKWTHGYIVYACPERKKEGY